MTHSSLATPLAAAPVQASERIEVIDVLRGFALLGILLVNMDLFANPVLTVIRPTVEQPGLLDSAASFLVHLMAESKFFSLFSFLFGLGFSIQILRLEARGAQVRRVYLRRLLALLGFGLVHAFLFWVGDILIIYAVLGMLLLVFRKAKPRTLLVWTVIFIILPILFMLAGWGLLSLARLGGPEVAAQIDASQAAQDAAYLAQIERAYTVYATGSFAEITVQRFNDYIQFSTSGNLFLTPSIFAMFLLGLFFGKRGIFQDVQSHLGLFRKLFWWGWTLGLAGNLLFAILVQGQSRASMTAQVVMGETALKLCAPLLMLAYVATIVLLFQRPAAQRWLAHLAPVGRMALTNYLGQSLVCTLIFYSYGLGWFGQVGKAAGLLLAVLIYAAQVSFSRFWLSRFLYGPMEWLWRLLTYLRQPAFRRATHQSLTRPVAD
jgi:uncharacterized protein